MLLIKNPLTYLALVLIASGFYFLITKKTFKIGLGSGNSTFRSPVFIAKGMASLLDSNLPPEHEQIVMPSWEKKLFGGFILIAGVAVLIASYFITYSK